MILPSPIKKAPFLGFLVLLFCFVSQKGFTQTVQLSTTTDSVSVGDYVYLNVKIQRNQLVDELLFPDSASFPEELQWNGLQQFQPTDFADSLSYELQYFGNGSISIPGIPIGFVTQGDTNFIFSNPITIPFKTVLPAEDAELKPIKPIFDFPGFNWPLLLILLTLIAAGIWAYFTLRKKEEVLVTKTQIKPEPFQNPILELENILRYLKEEYNLSQTKDFKYFYSSLSDSIRAYFEELYEIPALESTTRELLRYLDAFGVDQEMIKLTRSILNKSDMVKFAKFTPTLEKAWQCYDECITFKDRAALIDANRISRKKAAHEARFTLSESQESTEESTLKTKEDI